LPSTSRICIRKSKDTRRKDVCLVTRLSSHLVRYETDPASSVARMSSKQLNYIPSRNGW
jgi:hypothetical protein